MWWQVSVGIQLDGLILMTELTSYNMLNYFSASSVSEFNITAACLLLLLPNVNIKLNWTVKCGTVVVGTLSQLLT